MKMALNTVPYVEPKISYRRDWSKYTTTKLIAELSNCQWDWNIQDVQSHWNKIEEILITSVDKLAPIRKFSYQTNDYYKKF